MLLLWLILSLGFWHNRCLLFLTDIVYVNGINVLQSADFNEDLAKFTSSSGLAPNVVKGVLSGVLFFFKEALRVNLSAQHIKEDLLNFSNFSVSIYANW